jgi:DNA-binding SARP family transcriptional activator
MYEIKLLGPGQVFYDGKPIPGFPGQYHCLLFYYLILNRQVPLTREQVASVFWGDSPSQTARKNLRNTLWRLSQAFQSAGARLEDLITIHEECITFTGSAQYRLDIDDFKAATQYSLDLLNQDLKPEQVLMLETAIELYKGEYLEGVYEDWCLFERERLRLSYINVLTLLMDNSSRNGSYVRGLEYGQRILLLDPTREKIHRQMMMIHWLAGNREAALQQYRSCVEILQKELGIKPVPETVHLNETIIRSSPSPNKHTFGESVHLGGDQKVQSDPPLREMLQKLHLLEMIVEQTNTELHLLEQMVHRVMEAK